MSAYSIMAGLFVVGFMLGRVSARRSQEQADQLLRSEITRIGEQFREIAK